VYLDRDWLSSLAYGYSVAEHDGGQLLADRCAWAWRCLAAGQLALPGTYVVFDVAAATSLRRRAARLQHDHPWSHTGPLHRLRYFYTWPARSSPT
jgi:hypothetical protein